MPWSHPSILRPHNNDPTPHQKENRGIQTLLQNPQNSINKFFFIPWEGKGEKSLKFKNISEVYKKKILAADAVTNMYVPQRIYFLK